MSSPTLKFSNPLKYLPLFACVFAITPLAVDLYLPAMPRIADDLATDITLVQSSLSIYLAGYALGMLIFGPMADHFGRKYFLYGGITAFTIFSFALSYVESIEWFIVLRSLQAFAGGAATVVVPGTIRDLFGENTAKGLAYVSMTMMLAPMLAPSIGSAILIVSDWPMIFSVLSVYSLLVLWWALKKFPLIPTRRSSSKLSTSIINNYSTVFKNRSCYPFLFSVIFVSFTFFTYITAIPFVYITVYGLSEQMFSLYFGINVGALMLGNLINAKLVSRLGSLKLLRIALVFALLGAAAVVFCVTQGLPVVSVMISIGIMMSGLMVVSVNNDAQVLMCFPSNSGTATAVIGTLRFGCGALAGPALSLFYTGNALPFALMMLAALIVVCMIQLFVYINRRNLVAE